MGAPVMQPARHAAALVLRNAARAHTSVLMVLTLVRMVHRLAIVRRDAAGVCCLYWAVRPRPARQVGAFKAAIGPRCGSEEGCMRTVLATMMTALFGAVLPSAAVAQEAVLAYQRAVAQVCQKKVTPEMIHLYQEALKEMQTTRYAQGQDSNFFGLRSPERAYNDCLQAPGTLPR